ncbi:MULTISPECIES: very short patch repair endonuclease [Dietzia]|uniref:very short patch repair endonuclease n=1 Tax=Dietzia TaxID=37914 RepID=UPI000BDECB1B|nr:MULTISPECIES: very short patch repair endonuclease [Dietzia]
MTAERNQSPARAKRPAASSETVRVNMSRQKRRDTGCEMAVRRILHAEGIRYRVDFRPLRDERFRVDIGWRKYKLAVFIDGCFWHGCPEHGTVPKSNRTWWASKLYENQQRDRRVLATLEDAGWIAVRFWEHEPPRSIAHSIITLVQSRRPPC